MAVSFDFVTLRLATGGGITTAEDVRSLKAAGITHVIDCRYDVDDADLLSGSGLEYLYNPTADDGEPKPAEWFRRSLAFALPALALPRRKVYAHCEKGINRGPSTAASILMALGYTREEAWIQIVRHRKRDVIGLRYIGDAEMAVKELGYV